MTPRLVHRREVACWPWRLRHLATTPCRAVTCRTCARDVAQPILEAKSVPVCRYCALDSGLLPLEDEPFA